MEASSKEFTVASTLIRKLSPGVRFWLLLDSLLVLISGIQLFLLAGHTDRFFAWTISPPLTAAFLGSNYWASLPLVYLSSRQRTWENARLAVYGILIFTVLTLATTLAHLDRFHLFDPDPLPRIAAWFWLAVYAIVPLLLIILLAGQFRLPGGDPPRTNPLPGWMRAVLAVQSLTMLTAGIILLMAPLLPIWPWQLTPLTGTATGAWLVGIGVIAGQMSLENDWMRIKSGMLGYAVLGILQITSLLRYRASFEWQGLPALVYIFIVISILLVGGFGWYRGTRLNP